MWRGEANKQGVSSEKLEELVNYTKSLSHLEVLGLMTMAPYAEDPETIRWIFKELRQLSDKLQLKELSMGMSNDFEVAVEEGATYVRIGSALF